MKGVLTRKEYRNTGIETFMEQTIPHIIDSEQDVEPIYWEPSENYFGSQIISSLIASRTLAGKFNKYDKVLVPAQSRLIVDPDRTSAKLIPYVHDILPTTTNYSGWFATNIGRWMLKKIEDCDEIICGSKHTKAEVRRRTRFNGKSTVIYQGVDHLPETESREKDIDLLYVGSLIDRKNPEFTEKALEKAEELGFNVVTVNHSPTGLPGKNLVDISDKELAEIYSRTKYYLHPSMAEGFGRGPVEAQRYGAVPLAFGIPINDEILGDEGQSWIQIQEISDVIKILETSLEEKRSKAAWQNSERFKWRKTRKQLKQVMSDDESIKTAEEGEEARSYG